jgi:hypothetical protein
MATATKDKKPATKTAPPAQKGAVAVRKEPEGAVALAPEVQAMMEADAGAGMENVDSDSIAIPFLTALQKMSPQCDPDSPDYDADAKPGMLFNTVTYRRSFIKWGARKMGGGFKGAYDPVSAVNMRDKGEVVDLDGKLFFPDENGNVNPERSDKLSDTREHFVIILNPVTGQLQQAVMSLKSTQIKKSKQLMANLSGLQWSRADGSKFNPATFAVLLKVSTVPEKNDEGTWSGYRFDIAGKVSDPLQYTTAKAFHALVSSGKAVVDHSKDADTVENEPNGSGSGRSTAGRGGKF